MAGGDHSGIDLSLLKVRALPTEKEPSCRCWVGTCQPLNRCTVSVYVCVFVFHRICCVCVCVCVCVSQDPAGIFELIEVVGNGTYGQVYKVGARRVWTRGLGLGPKGEGAGHGLVELNSHALWGVCVCGEVG